MKFSERTAVEKLMELRMVRWWWSYALAERTKYANARANIVTLKKKALATLCMWSSTCRLSSAGAIHSRMMSRRSPCSFMSPLPCLLLPRASPADRRLRLIRRSSHHPCNGRASSGLCSARRTSVVAVIVTGPNALPSPRRRLPTPARGAIEANAGDERRRGKGEEAAVMEPIEAGERKPIVEPGERKPIDARCKSRPEREAARPHEPTAESGAAEASTDHCGAESAAAETSTDHCTAESGAAKATTRHSAAKAATDPRGVKTAAAAEASAAHPAHPGIHRRRRRHRADESDGGQCDYDLTHHSVSSFCRKHRLHPRIARRRCISDRHGVRGAASPRQR